MVKMTHRLSRKDWILAGFRALASGGAGALRVEPVSRELGTTKGSFYWHFVDLADWRAVMLAYWANAALDQIVTGLKQVPKGAARLHALTEIAVTGSRDPSHGGTAAEPALRAWARHDPMVADAVHRVDAGRITFLADSFAHMRNDGQDGMAEGRLFYAAYLGLQALPGDTAMNIADLKRLIAALGAKTDGL